MAGAGNIFSLFLCVLWDIPRLCLLWCFVFCLGERSAFFDMILYACFFPFLCVYLYAYLHPCICFSSVASVYQ
jgi:hypothetical protein